MKWIKLTLLEAGFLRDTIDNLGGEWGCDAADKDEALELLDGAVDNAVEEEIESG